MTWRETSVSLPRQLTFCRRPSHFSQVFFLGALFAFVSAANAS